MAIMHPCLGTFVPYMIDTSAGGHSRCIRLQGCCTVCFTASYCAAQQILRHGYPLLDCAELEGRSYADKGRRGHYSKFQDLCRSFQRRNEGGRRVVRHPIIQASVLEELTQLLYLGNSLAPARSLTVPCTACGERNEGVAFPLLPLK
jgi:hypothetical protein